MSLKLDLKLILFTVVAIFSREEALKKVTGLLEKMGADPELVKISRRDEELVASAPPGQEQIVMAR